MEEIKGGGGEFVECISLPKLHATDTGVSLFSKFYSCSLFTIWNVSISSICCFECECEFDDDRGKKKKRVKINLLQMDICLPLAISISIKLLYLLYEVIKEFLLTHGGKFAIK